MSGFISNGTLFYRVTRQTFSPLPFDGEIIQASLYNSDFFGVIDSDYHLWFGIGQRGITPQLNPILPDIEFRAVSISTTLSAAIDTDGNIWCMGRITGIFFTDEFRKLTEGINFTSVAVYDDLCMALDDQGNLYGLGFLAENGSPVTYRTFVRIRDNIKFIRSARFKLICVDNNDNLWLLNHDTSDNIMAPGQFYQITQDSWVKDATASSYDELYILSINGDVYMLYDYRSKLNGAEPVNMIQIAQNIRQIDEYLYYSVLLLDVNGELFEHKPAHVQEAPTKLPGLTADFLLNQTNVIAGRRRFLRTKSARNG